MSELFKALNFGDDYIVSDKIVAKVIAGTPEAEKLVMKLKKSMKNILKLQKTNVLTPEGQKIIREKCQEFDAREFGL